MRRLNNLGSIQVISGIKLIYKWLLKFEVFLPWKQQGCRWRTSPSNLRDEIIESPEDNRVPRNSVFLSGEGTDFSKSLVFPKSEQY